MVECFSHAAPDNHFVAGPDCGVADSAGRDVAHACRHPTIGSGVVSATCMQIVHIVTSAPDNHFVTGPHCAVAESRDRRIRRTGGQPTVRAWTVSAATVQVAIATTSRSAPDDHLTAHPYRRVVAS